ncbi:MAG: hypothetical protein AAFO82_09815 [Bacteroidota bacterium]
MRFYMITFLLLLTQFTFTQNLEKAQLTIQATEEKINIDGRLEETIWQKTEVATNFWKQSPIDGVLAEIQTEVRMTYDEKNVYLAVTCWDDDDYVIQSLKRDVFGGSD